MSFLSIKGNRTGLPHHRPGGASCCPLTKADSIRSAREPPDFNRRASGPSFGAQTL